MIIGIYQYFKDIDLIYFKYGKISHLLIHH